jgi:hypothetical protein
MLRCILFACAIATLAARLTAQPCIDVTRFDFKNVELRIGGQADGSRQPERSIRLRNGVGFISDSPASLESRDWKITLKVNRVVRPDASTWAKVIVLDQNHLAGTGDWRHVLVYSCANGSLVRLFQYASEGMALEHTDGRTIRLYRAQWKSSDAHCCPSQHLELTYEWDVLEHRYRRKASIASDGFDLPKDEN